MKKYSFKIVRQNINLDEINITQVKCSGNSLFNIIMEIFWGIVSIIILILTVEMVHSLDGFLAFCFLNSIFILPFIYLLLKIKNYYFSIENDKISYKNIFGNMYEYNIRDIKYVKRVLNRRPEVFWIKMEDNKSILVSDYSTNFDLLKLRFQKERLI